MVKEKRPSTESKWRVNAIPCKPLLSLQMIEGKRQIIQWLLKPPLIYKPHLESYY